MAGRRRRGVALAVLAVLVAAAAAAGGWLATAGPPNGIPVPPVERLSQNAAVQALRQAGLKERISVVYDDDVPADLVAGTNPGEGHRVGRGAVITLQISRGPEHVEVPDLQGLTQVTALAALRERGLRFGEIKKEYQADVPAGRIYRQNPDAGDEADNGARVEIRISLGARPEDVPDVEGRSIADARRALERRGFLVAVAKQKAYDNDSNPGQVASQNPAGNAKLAPGRTVTLVESLGPKLVKVPDVTDETVARAEALLRQKGFEPRSFGTDLLDRVVTQRPEGGTMSPQGSVVTLGTL
jgi:serine/threonine-protein kinase